MSIYLGGNNKLKGAYIGKINYRDRQGPCPDGFHIPLINEVNNLLEYMRQFGLGDREGIKQYLLMPPAGYRTTTTANVSRQGSDLYYRTCEVSTTVNRSRCLMAYDNYPILSQFFQAGGASIRPFKNEPVYPDNTWNVLYGTIDNGISHNATLGLISIVRGDNIITIADKNIGATTVYNDGDTLSEANCGGYFQRGNNYMFPFTGNVTTDNTLIDASSYGPGNYYYGETYIINTQTWMTSVNSNIWGGASPNRTPIKRIVMFPDGVTEKQIRPELMGPGVYHNATLGVISFSSDGQNWITISDKNVGATEYEGGRTVASLGLRYQRGNNHGFTDDELEAVVIVGQKDASSFGPGQYSSNEYYWHNLDVAVNWQNPFNKDLRGDVTDTLEARRGPCNVGYHIPTADEFRALMSMVTTWGVDGLYDVTNGMIGNQIWNITLPDGRGPTVDIGPLYWTSSTENDDYLLFSDHGRDGAIFGIRTAYDAWSKYMGCAIRPFKNTPVHPDETWTVLYQSS